MEKEKRNHTFCLYVIVSISLCALLQGLAYYQWNCGTGKSESNYFSTFGRFQAAARGRNEICVVGSSISGRLPGREVGNEQVGNLGSDGGSPFDGISLLAEGVIPIPKFLVVEMNTLYNSLEIPESSTVKGSRGIWFKTGTRFPLLSASARPTAMVYAKLLNRDRIINAPIFAQVDSPTTYANDYKLDFTFTQVERDRLEQTLQKLTFLKQKGCHIILITMPAGVIQERDRQRMEASIYLYSQELQLPHLDLEKKIPRHLLHFTDSVHLGPESAERILATIRHFCKN